MKRLLPLIIIFVLLFQTVSFAETPIKILLDDTQLVLSSQPVVISGVTLVPISDILRPIGADIYWDPNTRTAIINKDDTEIVIVIGQSYATVNGNKINLALPARLQSGRTMIPLRFVSESLGYNVQWDGVNRKIFVDTTIPNGTKVFYPGMYKVGTEIETGLYKIIAGDYAYIEGLKDTKSEFESINWNGSYKNTGYFEIMESDLYIKANWGKFYKFDLATAKPKLLDSYPDGIYLVGIDIAPGEYKIDVGDDSYGYVQRSSDVNSDLYKIIANGSFSGPSYITIEPSDFSVRISSCTLTPIK